MGGRPVLRQSRQGSGANPDRGRGRVQSAATDALRRHRQGSPRQHSALPDEAQLPDRAQSSGQAARGKTGQRGGRSRCPNRTGTGHRRTGGVRAAAVGCPGWRPAPLCQTGFGRAGLEDRRAGFELATANCFIYPRGSWGPSSASFLVGPDRHWHAGEELGEE